MAIETVVISFAASIGLRLLASAIEKSPKQDFNENLPDSSYRKAIPKTYNYYRQDANWIEPFGEDEAFFKKRRGSRGLFRKNTRRDVLFGRFLGTVTHSQTDHVAIWVEGKLRSKLEDATDEQIQGSQGFLKDVTWLDGSFQQQGWSEGNLEIAGKEYYEQISAGTTKDYNHNSAVGYRGISCIGFKELDLSEDVKTSTLPTVGVLSKTKITYDVADICTDICKDSGILPEEIDVSELVGLACKGFSRPQNGQSYGEAIANLGLAFRFFATETNEGILSFRFYDRPEGILSLSWESFLPMEDGRLWLEAEADPLDLPKTVNLNFIDPATDYLENSVISDEYPQAGNQNEDSISVSVVMSEEEAKALANWHLNQVWIRSKSYSFKLSLGSLGSFVVGDILGLPNGDVVQVQNYTVGADYTLDVEAVRYDSKSTTTVANVNNTSSTYNQTPASNSGVDDGSYNSDGSVNYGNLKLLDLPLAHPSHSEIGFYCFSDRTASVLYLDRGEGLEEELTFVETSVFGRCDTTLASVINYNLLSGELPIADVVNTLDITLTAGALLNGISDTAFATDSRVAFIGRYDGTNWVGEYVAFQYADTLSSGRYQLQNLRRGLRGTEGYIDKHTAGEEFFLLLGDEAYWERVVDEQNAIGSTYTGKLEVVAGQDLSITPGLTLNLTGRSLLPLPPVDVVISEDPEGSLVFEFTSRNRGSDRTIGEDSDSFSLTLLSSTGGVTRTITGGNPLIYPQAQLILDGLDKNAIDGNIYKVSSIVGLGLEGLIRDLGVSGTSNTVVTNSGGTKGFKYVSANHTITTDDDGYWLLVDTNTADVDITLTEVSTIKFWVQNVGVKKVNLLGNLTATDSVLRGSEAIYLVNRSSVWHGLLSGRVDIPQHLIVNTDFTLSQVHHNIIVSVESATTVTVTLDENAIVNPKDFHTTIRKKGEGDVYLEVAGNSVLESIGSTLSARYTAAYVGYEGNGTWIALGAFGFTGGDYQPIGGEGGSSDGAVPTNGLQLWLDATDSSTLTLSGSEVTAWADKSGNDNGAVKSHGSPQLNSNAIVFDGDDGFDLPFGFSGAQPRTIFLSMKITAVDPNSRLYMYSYGSTANSGYLFGHGTTNDRSLGLNGHNPGFGINTNAGVYNLNEWIITQVEYDDAGVCSLYLNNQLLAQGSIALNTDNQNGILGYLIFNNVADRFMFGAIKEKIVYDRVLSETERNDIYNSMLSKLP